MSPKRISGMEKEQPVNCSIEDIEKVLKKDHKEVGESDRAIEKLKIALNKLNKNS